jgi:hypothetical protein
MPALPGRRDQRRLPHQQLGRGGASLAQGQGRWVARRALAQGLPHARSRQVAAQNDYLHGGQPLAQARAAPSSPVGEYQPVPNWVG